MAKMSDEQIEANFNYLAKQISDSNQQIVSLTYQVLTERMIIDKMLLVLDDELVATVRNQLTVLADVAEGLVDFTVQSSKASEENEEWTRAGARSMIERFRAIATGDTEASPAPAPFPFTVIDGGKPDHT